MINKTYDMIKAASDLLGVPMDPLSTFERSIAELVLRLAEEVQMLKEPLGTPEQRSSLQQAEVKAEGLPEENCGCCRFYDMPPDPETQQGSCRWHPEYVPRYDGDWCGRFLRIPAVLP